MKKDNITGVTGKEEFSTAEEAEEFYDKASMVRSDVALQRNIEATTIACLLTDTQLIPTAFRILRPVDFFDKGLLEMYNCIIAVWQANLVVDYGSVFHYSRGRFQIPSKAFTTVSTAISNLSIVPKQAQIMFQKEAACRIRTKIGFLTAFRKAFAIDAPSDIFDQTIELSELLKDVLRINELPVDTLHDAGLKVGALQELNLKSGKFSGVTTTFKSLDYRTGGFADTNLILIAGRPGMGKTALIISMLKYKIKNNEPFIFFSLEMSLTEILKRLFAQLYYINLNRITANQLTPLESTQFFEFCASLPSNCYIIDDVFDLTQIELISKKHVEENGIREIYLDYLHLTRGVPGDNPNQVIGATSNRLKILAKELNIPVIALSQLSREPKPNFKTQKYTVRDLTPMLSDLRDSGSLEQDADIVIFLLRLEYYQDKLESYDDSENSKISIIYAKFRGGSPFTQKMGWKKEYALVEDDQETLDKIDKKTIIENERVNSNPSQDEYVSPDF